MKSQAKRIGPYEVVELKHPDMDAKTAVLSVRISADLKRRMGEACDAGPYCVSITSLTQRGIELAIRELAELRKTMPE